MWLYLPASISASSPERQASTWPSESQFQALAASATARGKSALPAFWRRAWKTGALNLLRSGVTCEPSRANSSVAAWLESLGVSPARISASRASGPASKASTPDCGSSTSASFARFDPDGCLLRTSPQFSLFPTEESFSEGLPDSGSMRSGHLYELPMWEPRTSGSGSSSSRTGQNWPAPRAEDSESCGNHPGAVDSLGGAVKKWGTPKLGTNNGNGQEHPTRGSRIEDQVVVWKTPHGMGNLDATGKRGGSGGGEFAKQANNWTTP